MGFGFPRMTLLQAIVLGLVQGLTEFLPVSSSGHLVLVQEWMGVEDRGVTFEILVHFGTLLSVVIYFWKRLWRMLLSILPPFREEFSGERRTIFYLFLASIPAGVAVVTPLKDVFEGAYDRPTVVALLLLVTGSLLFLPRLLARCSGGRGNEEGGHGEGKEMTAGPALAMGVGQAFAILPGISRSGSSIVSGLLAGVKPSAAAEFSFLMAIPAIAAAAVLELRDLGELETELLHRYLVGGAVAFLSGLAAIYTVLASIRRGRFEFFGIYCLIAGVAAFCYFQFS